ncbi:diaminopimelate decarboxylase [Lacticaseibacillus sharpeae JCM 1186 = DSM 20505]|uniref:Diaminopimelate decarboxylase n=1 Tax=Lacticaseibacillus sharpeae JCM 1186 = DSM 20505 TaxID=1291052 RepID=A0A0R1ZK28_9LACO|nr:diaminopimelate decarboxylase [Lacticaseibacillus sharpeae JCM 1186 = DSM 20505]
MTIPFTTNDAGALTIGGVPATDLAQQYGTPLYVYDVERIRGAIRAYRTAFDQHNVDYAVSYAAKAFASVAMFQVAAEEQAHLDVVSGGEIATAQKAGFNMANVSFNGNNKSDDELNYALEVGLGTIIVDNDFELVRLAKLAAAKGIKQKILLRIAPAVSAHTHEYIMTGQADSKFGFDVASGQVADAIKKAEAETSLDLLGLHAHIGSQIFEIEGFVAEAEKLVELAAANHFTPRVFDVGGGFGIQYTDDDKPLASNKFIDALVAVIEKGAHANGWDTPAIWIEPGRSIVGAAGTTLYTAGSSKTIPGVRTYQTVDGGMGDNIRPALYQADYQAVVADQATAPATTTVTLAGKYCESGDILIKDAKLPAIKPGDIIALLSTGAYGYSMASLYNRNPRPAVVFAENGKSQEVIRRETWEDLTDHDLDYQG